MQEQQAEHISKALPSYQEELLAALEAVTDPAITNLALDDLSRVVLDRIYTVTKADNLAILLLNEERTLLLPHAIRGIEEAVINDVRVPFGQGFAGRIAALAVPLVLYDPSPDEVITPVLREHLHTLLGVPLIVQKHVIGVVHIGLKRRYLFTDHDIALFVRVANCLAQATEQALLREAEQQAHNEAIKRARELETIFEALTDGVIVYDQQGLILHSNSTAHQILGLESHPAGLSRRSLTERLAVYQPRDGYGHPFTPETLPVNRLLHGERLTGSKAVDMLLSTLDGREALLTINGAPLFDEQEHIRGAVCILHDVTEQKHMQRRLQILDACIAVVETLVQYTAPEGHLEKAKSTGITATQRIGQTILALAQPLLGYSHALILEIQSDTQSLSPLEVTGFSPYQKQLLRTLLAGAHLSTLITDPDTIALLERQELAPFDITQSSLLRLLFPVQCVPNCLFVPIYVASRLTGLLGVAFADRAYKMSTEDRVLLTAIGKLCALALQHEQQAIERNRLREASDLLNEQLECVNALQSTFISVVGHEFRTALTGIEGFSELLADEEFTSEEVKDFANDISKEALRLHRMITDLLDLEQMKKGKMQLHLEHVDINTLVTEAVKRIRLTKPDYHFQLHLDTRCPHLQGDYDKLTQMISNLLSNAVKYSPAGGDIVISSTVEGTHVHLRIQDHGIGIPPERVKDIFTPYQRIASQYTRYISGTGLGLGIVKQIVELHQGNIWVESMLGQGSLFHVTLPLEP
jgi:signal transduction histidine kinase/PAS domain-containing protein